MTEYAYLIELQDSKMPKPLYWHGSFGDEFKHLTDDHMKAIRFSRKEDAEAVLTGVLDGFPFKAIEHAWD